MIAGMPISLMEQAAQSLGEETYTKLVASNTGGRDLLNFSYP